MVSSATIDRVVAAAGRQLREMPVGFKWFAQELHDGVTAFAGEESAGASFLDRHGLPWSTDKDGIIMALLAAEIVATQKCDPSQYYQALCAQHGTAYYQRIDVTSSAEGNAAFADIRADKLTISELANID